MAKILEFRVPSAEARSRPRRRRERTAEIVIFPGVRYERWPTAEAKSEATVSRSPRDILKIVE